MSIVGRVRDSSTFAAGQRSEIGRYEVPTEVSLPGFGIGMINQDFHIAGIWQVVTERLKRAVMYSMGLQTTQPTSGGAVTAYKNCCANCVEPSRPQQWGPDLPFFGHASHADPLDGWRCCSQKRVMSRPIQVRQH